MRIAKVVLGLFLCAASLSAQTGPRSAARRGGEPAVPQAVAPCLRAALESHTLFLRLQDLPGLDTARSLEIDLDLDGERLAAERFLLGQAKAGDVEILSRQPELLERIYKAAAKAGARMRLTVRLDGTVVRETSFRDLVTASRLLKQRGLTPLTLLSEVVDPSRTDAPFRPDLGGRSPVVTKSSEPDPECVQACYDTYGYCSSVEQVGCECHPNCVSQCISNCPHSCTDPLSVSERTVTEITGGQLVDYWCYEDWFEWDFHDGHYYATYLVTYKHTRIRTTLHCDSSVTEEVIGVSYSSGYCSFRDYPTCSYPWSPTSYPPAGPC